RFSGARVLDRICAKGSVLCAGTGRRCRIKDSRCGADRRGVAGSDRCRLGRRVFSGDREAYWRTLTKPKPGSDSIRTDKFDQPEVAMIDRFPGLTPTRSRAVVHGDLV